MEDRVNPLDDLSPVKRALVQLKDLRARLQAAERARTEPVAVVGIGCRFPGGVTGPDSFWSLLSTGGDAIAEVPAMRWDLARYFDPDPDAPGKMYTRFGGFVEDLDRFDPAFFGITPREAIAMDPQQRLLLEVCWEALEHGGHAPDRLMGTPVGVFVGISANEYLQLELRSTPPERIDPYLATGGSPSVAAGRLSYVLGLEGPCVTVDTACSSSLVAVHLAVQSLRAGECRMAVAGGASAILLPELSINFSRARMMAPDGRCKTFDARADGYVRSEGCGIVVLKRLTDAEAEGDRILAVIRGSAVNQDGRSSGLTVPNGTAQERVIREALAHGGVDPAHVDYVEAHGTGTSLGDPIELRALGAALTRSRSGEVPLLVGSVKTNIGHLEAAAGAAGLIKLVLSLQHGEIPAHLHLRERNPLVDWRALRIDVPTARTPWPRNGHARTAGVSSFGFSGTNAHVVVEEPPAPAARPRAADRSTHVVTVSARSEHALRAAAEALHGHLRTHADIALPDVGYTRNAGRSHFSHRLALVARSTDDASARLTAWLAGTADSRVFHGRIEGVERPRVAFLFSGQGVQYVGMARTLYDTHPAFREALDRAAAIADPLLDVPLLTLLYGEDRGRLDQTRYAQPALFAVEYALAMLWQSWGVQPDAVLGHSLGEDVAACVAGIFSLEDGLRMIVARGRLMQELGRPGEMHAVFAPVAAVKAAIGSDAPSVSIAAVNGPEHIAIAGAPEDLQRVLDRLATQGFRVRRMNASHAFHSPLMDPAMAAFDEVARGVAFTEPRITFISSLTGEPAQVGEATTPAYWCRHARESVQFCDGIRALVRQGVTCFVEIGPDPVLLGMGRRCVPDDYGVWVPSVRRDSDDVDAMLSGLAALYAKGVQVDWVRFDEPFGRAIVPLPTYPFERQRFWIEQPAAAPAADVHDAKLEAAVKAARQQSLEGPLDLALPTYPEKWALLERLTTAYVGRALADLGVFDTPGTTVVAEELIRQRGIGPSYRRLLERWLERAASKGLLQRIGTGYVAGARFHDLLTPELLAEARAAFTDNPAILEYVERCGPALAAVITGRESPLELLFPDGSSDLAERLYEHSPVSRYFNAIARSAVQGALGAHGGHPLRIIEIGAGTGGTTAAILPLVTAGARYTFTDIGPFFLGRAQEKFAAFDFVRYATLDIEQPVEAQGFTRHTFDVVLAANVIHATRNLDDTLTHVKDLLAPGGLIVFVEATEHPAWFDITTGLISGWQRFEDGWRGDVPLLHADRWQAALGAHGFEDVVTLPSAGSPASILGQHVIVARGPAVVDSTVAGTAHRTAAAPEAAPIAASHPSAPAASELLDTIRQLPDSERHERLVTLVQEAVVRVLRLDMSRAPEPDQRLMEFGVDSLMAVELRNALSTQLQVRRRLPATLMFDHPTADAIAGFIDRTYLRASDAEVPRPETAPVPAVPPTASTEAIESLDDSDVEALLNERLGRLEAQ